MKKILCILLVVLMCLTAAPLGGFAELDFGVTANALNTTGKCGENATYTFSATGELIISGTGAIYADAFYYNKEIANVVIGDGITEIGADAFNGCSNLTTLDLGNTVMVIGDNAFYHCYNLTDVDIPDSVITIGWAAFSNCDSLTSVTIPDSVTTIYAWAFSDCNNLKSVTIGNGVIFIGDFAFGDCISLTNIHISDSVATIGENAFHNTEYYNTSCNWENQVLYIGRYLIKANTSLSGFYTIKQNSINIADAAFADCEHLMGITIPNSIENIGSFAFSWCDNLTSITIPDSVLNIDNTAFHNCDNLSSINVDENNPTYSNDDNGILFNKNKTILVKYPEGKFNISYVIPNGTKIIDDYAFYSCNNLMNVSIPNSVTDISDYSFYYCGLTSVTIPNSVTTIGEGAFRCCSNLMSITVDANNTSYSSDARGALFNREKTVLIQYPIRQNKISYNIPNGVEIVDDHAFMWCGRLQSISVPNSVTTIGNTAFFDCYGLKSITLGNSVTTIDALAFGSCKNLTDVYYSNFEEEWNKIEIRSGNTELLNAKIHFNTCAHIWLDATCIEPTKCEKCGATEGTVIYHTFTEQLDEKYLKTPATCGKKAVYYYSCSVCGLSSGETNEAKTFEYGIAPEHTWGPAQTIPATCTEPEMKVQTCTRCGQKYAKKGSGIALGHNMDEVAAKEATCKEAGNNKYYACNRCDKYFKDAEGYIETTVAAETIAKCEHKFTKYNVVKDATCEANAVEKATCDVCEEATHERPMPGTMLAHTFKDYKSDGNATCKADGTMTAVCEMCKEAKDTKTEVDSHKTAPHTPDAAGVRCTLCGEMLVCLHTYSAEKLITKTPTCTTEGQKAIVCSKCKANKPGSEEVIPATGHAWDEGEVIKAATCNEAGAKKFKCNNKCGETKTEEILATGNHTYSEDKLITITPTCTSEGKKATVCINCGDIKSGSEEIVPATHNYPDDWSVLVEPDCETKGINVKICLNCNDIITQKLPKAGHADKDGDSKCDTCDKEIIVTEPDEPDNKDEEKPCSCDCHAGGIKAFFFKFLNFFAKIFDKSARVCECGKSH